MKRKILAGVMAFLLIFSTLSQDLIAFADTSSNSSDLVTVTVTNAETDEALAGGTISKSTQFKASYKFKDVAINTTDDGAIQQGETLELPSITGISQFNLSAQTIKVYDTTNTIEFGEVVITPDTDKDLATVEFTLTSDQAGTLSNAYFDIILALNETLTTERREITFPDGSVYTFTIKEYVTTPPSLSIEATKKDDTTVSWEVDITNAETPTEYENGYTISIDLSDDESYVSDSFKINQESQTATYDESSKTLTFSIDSPTTDSKAVTQITYDTTTAFSLKESDITNNVTEMEVALTDTANLIDNSDNSYIYSEPVSDTETLTKSVKQWLNKEVTGSVTTDGIINWKITVNNNGYSLQNVTLYDLFAGDGANMTLVDGVVNVETTNNSTGETTTSSLSASLNETNSSEYTWSALLGNMTGDTTIVISYSTQITNYADYLKQNHSSNPKNDAWVTYEYDFDGNGTSEFKGPSVTKEASVNLSSGIEIRGVSYDPSTHELTWKVLVNQGYQPVTEVKITDLIPSEQTYVDSSISEVSLINSDGETVSTLSVTPTPTEDLSDNNNILINLGSLVDSEDSSKGYEAVFTLKTVLTDDAASTWTNNTSTTFSNTVSLDIAENASAQASTAKISYTSNVLKTSIDNYSYNDHTVDVTVTVDTNKMDMENAVVVDSLNYDDYSFEIVDDTVYVNGTETEHSLNDEGNLVVSLGDISKDEGDSSIKTISFKAKVNSDNYETINNGTFSICNTAKLTTDDITKLTDLNAVEVTSEKITITNSIIKKEGQADSSTGQADYTVYINRARLDLTNNFTVRDTLGSSMELDQLSIALYQCDTDDDGNITAETLVDSSEYTVSVEINSENKTVMDVTLPETNYVYKLTYSAQLVDVTLADCSNNISIVYKDSSSFASSSQNLKTSFKAGAEFTSAAYLYIEAVDSKGNALSGVSFAVIDPDTNEEVLVLTTKTDGVATAISTKLTEGKTYIVEELETPDTYKEVESQETEAVGLGKSNAQTLTFTHEKLSTTIKIYNRANTEDGDLLDATSLVLTKDGSEVASWNSTDANAYEATIYLDSEYCLTATAPSDYTSGEAISFKLVQNATTGELKLTQLVDGSYVNVDAINMVNVAKDRLSFSVSKLSDSQETEIEGATLAISTASELTEDSLVERWTTNGAAHKTSLAEGEYYLIEESAPVGFEVANTIKFKIDSDLKLYVADEEDNNTLVETTASTSSDSDETSSTSLTISMIDKHNTSETASFTLSPSTLGLSDDTFSALSFVVKTYADGDLDSQTSELITVEAVAADEENLEYSYALNYQDEYILLAQNTIDGYEAIPAISFKIMGSVDEEGNIVDTLLLYSAATNSYVTSTLENLQSLVVLKKAEVAGDYDDNGIGETHSYQFDIMNLEVAKSEDAYLGALGELGADETDTNKVDAQKADRLKQTGGFIGTAWSYLVSLGLVLTGLALVFKKKEDNND
ncbi:prealbumin-like fold domain-containing protein [Lachnospira pectinoschiza]|uniref:Collagen binding domain-containing protein n=1 Tax=Lachnospira pectinoschiza TaxID=28052 RepID=A0A1G9T1I8_9FIRM|nr:SpaA isopeptide-forming pilin-related protein [Lachnospira pectinoschiza]SDM41569.1 Collagen binding domain-containing protein [Lachnospira pectinoschiza]